MKNITKKELKHWIDFLYLDLKDSYVNVGGYNFYLSQIPEFEMIQKDIDKKYQQNKPVSIKINALNKFNKKVNFPCTEEEFFFIRKKLETAKMTLDEFKPFLLEQLKEAKPKDLACFLQYIDDYFHEIKVNFAET